MPGGKQMKVAIVIDKWKLSIFEKCLMDNAFINFTVGSFTSDSCVINVTTNESNLSILEKVIRKAQQKAAN